MKMNLRQTPYSRRGSYMALSQLSENWNNKGNAPGLYLRTIHGSAMTPLAARLSLERDAREVPYEAELDQAALVLAAGEGRLEFCFDDGDTLLIRGTGGLALCLDFLTSWGPYDYIYEEMPQAGAGEGRVCYMANCYKNNCRYLVWAQEGKIALEQQWEESSALYSRLWAGGDKGFLLILKEIETEWDGGVDEYSFEESRDRTWQDFLAFYRAMPECPPPYGQTALLAAYLNWTSLVRKDGFLPREAMLMSKNWMCSVWSWDHCFNAIALSYHNPELAWDQFMLMFDFQDPTGRLPDSVNDAHVVWNYCKPPIHGWALSKMMEHMRLTPGQMEEAYGCLAKWTRWWLHRRMDRKLGLCVYDHGNDSGWDNSTVFSILPPVASPELQAYLILQMDVLADLAGRLGILEEQREWEERSGELLKRLLEKGFRDGLPVPIQCSTGEPVENESLLPYETILLGERLPKECRRAMTEILESGRFLTPFGFATESPQSPLYRCDGYWRGPIWAPSTMLLLDGLARCGEEGLVQEAARRFANMAAASGFAENYDALTGEGLRDKAYTWTSSAFLVMTHEYLKGDTDR